jgi:hypothetical protein
MHVTSPAPRGIWQDVLNADEHALVTQTPTWIDSICAIGRYEDASRLYEISGGQQLIMPMVRRKQIFTSLASQASPPSSWGIGGLISQGAIHSDDIAAVFEDLNQHPALRTSIRPNPLAGEEWAAAKPSGVIAIPRVAHVLDLDGGFEAVWTKKFKSGTRNKVRKAEKSGLTVECDTSGKLVPVFYNLFLQSVDRWASQQHEPLALARWRAKQRDPLDKFVRLAQRLGDSFRLWVAWSDGQPAATILVLQGKNAHYTRGAMNKQLAGPTRANDLLQKLAIEDACRAGCRYYHMGESGNSTSLSHFKARFGAQPYKYAEYRLERLPITTIDEWIRSLVKKIIKFKDT